MGTSASILEECEHIWHEELSKKSGDLQRARTLVESIEIPYNQIKSENGQASQRRAEKLMKDEIISLYSAIKNTFPFDKEKRIYQFLQVDVIRASRLPILNYQEVNEMMVRILYYTYTKNSDLEYLGGQAYLIVPFLLSAICQYENISPDIISGPNYEFPWMHSEIIEAHSFYLFESFIRQNSTDLNHWELNNESFKQICFKRNKEIFKWISNMDDYFYSTLSRPIFCKMLKTLRHELRLFDLLITNQYQPGFVYRFRFSISVEYAIHFKKNIIPKRSGPVKTDEQGIDELTRLINTFENNPEDNKIVNQLIIRAYQTSKSETSITPYKS